MENLRANINAKQAPASLHRRKDRKLLVVPEIMAAAKR